MLLIYFICSGLYLLISYNEKKKNLLQWQATPVLLPGKSHGWRSLVGWSPWGRYESDATEWLHFHFSLSRNGEGNGNPLQCSCLENPRDGGAWWAAVYGVAQSWTRLTQLSSSSTPNLSSLPSSFVTMFVLYDDYLFNVEILGGSLCSFLWQFMVQTKASGSKR